MNRTHLLTAAALTLLATAGSVAQAQGRGQGKQEEHKKEQDDRNRKAVPQQEQQQRARQEQERAAQYQRQLDAQMRAAQQQAIQLQAEKRVAQARAQEQYNAQLRQQQERLRAARDYSRDPYVTTPHTYRYVVSGATRQTNQYGADVLRAAVNTGYQQGYNAGQADRQDGRRASYQNAFGYRDANYGYNGNYVAQSDYNYYFRQGFRRGYDDGYNSRTQYGTSLNGNPSILATLLTSILGFTSIR